MHAGGYAYGYTDKKIDNVPFDILLALPLLIRLNFNQPIFMPILVIQAVSSRCYT